MRLVGGRGGAGKYNLTLKGAHINHLWLWSLELGRLPLGAWSVAVCRLELVALGLTFRTSMFILGLGGPQLSKLRSPLPCAILFMVGFHCLYS